MYYVGLRLKVLITSLIRQFLGIAVVAAAIRVVSERVVHLGRG